MREIMTPQEGIAFLKNLGASFSDDGVASFPEQSLSRTAQDLTVAVLQLADAVYAQERPLLQVVQHIGAIFTITQDRDGRDHQGKFRREQEGRPASLASQLTAQLGPILHFMQGSASHDFGKLVRGFATYDPDNPNFGTEESLRLLSGHRVLFFADTDGRGGRNLDSIARIAKGVLSHEVQGNAVRLNAAEKEELEAIADSSDRASEEHAMIAHKRSLLTAGFVFLATTTPGDEIAKRLAERLDFEPEIWTFCNNIPKPPKNGGNRVAPSTG